MSSLLGLVLAKLVEVPQLSRYSSAEEIVETVREAGGSLDIDNFHESELDLVYESIAAGSLILEAGSWADTDWLILP